MWSLRYAMVHAAPRPTPISPAGLEVFNRDFSEGMTQESMNAMQAALDDGWEPFSVVTVNAFMQVMWFRRPETGPTPSVEELPGQYI